MSASDTGVVCEHLAFSYGPGAPAMMFDCHFSANAITALMGPSGSGKSTLVALIAGFEAPGSGRVLIDGRDVTEMAPDARPVSIVFQDNNLFAHLSAGDNAALGISPRLRLDAADRARLADAFDRVGLGGYMHRMPGALSGGERQRVALARALLRQRPVLVLDEAFGSLGPALRDSMLDLVAGLQRETGMTVIMVTHAPQDARRIASRIVFVSAGAVHAQGLMTDVLGDDDNAAVRAYLGE